MASNSSTLNGASVNAGITPNRGDAKRRTMNRVMTTLTAACAFFAVGILVLILGYIAAQGLSALSIQFLIDTPKPIGEGGGIGNAILGSFILLLISSLIGLPLGILIGIYLAEFGGRGFGNLIRFIADTMTGVPSIIIGVFVYTIILALRDYFPDFPQFTALAGGIALALIMIPIVARTTEEMIRLVPHSMREGALALGAPQWRVTLGVVLPAAASGIATGAMLAVARVSGETAPLLFTAFNNSFYTPYIDDPVSSLTVQIYNYAISPYPEWHAQAWAATLVLMTLILLINIVVRYLTRRKF